MNTSPLSQTHTPPNTVSRRSVAHGLAWAAPAVALVSAAPAFAASKTALSATVCSLFYGAGASVNYQVHRMSLGVTSSTGLIPKDTVFTWTVNLSGTDLMEAPTTNYSANNRWSLTLSPAAGTPTTSFTVTLKVNATDVTANELNCVPQLIWNDSASIKGGTTVSITTTSTAPNLGTGTPSALSYRVATRYPVSVNSAGRRPHVYLAKSGGQACYPAIRYELTAASKLTTCGNDGNDTSTQYPGGTCVKYPATTAEIGLQVDLPKVC